MRPQGLKPALILKLHPALERHSSTVLPGIHEFFRNRRKPCPS
jgi:hypothetical protein